MSELKPCPCPFCGGEPVVESHFSCVYERIYGEVECKTCHTKKRGTKTFDTYDASYEGYDTPAWVANAHKEAKQSAIEAWNRRVGCESADEYTVSNRPQDGSWRVGEGEKG